MKIYTKREICFCKGVITEICIFIWYLYLQAPNFYIFLIINIVYTLPNDTQIHITANLDLFKIVTSAGSIMFGDPLCLSIGPSTMKHF